MSHTKEPWLTKDRPDGPFWHFYSGNQAIGSAHASAKGTPMADEFKANARRIVACVNACAGLSTEELEGYKAHQLSDGLKLIDVRQERDKLEKQVEGLINQLSKHQIDAALGRAVNRAAEELPFGYDLHIEIEKDAGTVRLYQPDGEEIDQEFHDCDHFSHAVDNAINVAIQMAEKGGTV